MVIKKVMAPFRADAKPQETVDVYDVEGLCDAIEEVVLKRKQSTPGRGTEHQGVASDQFVMRRSFTYAFPASPSGVGEIGQIIADLCGNRSLFEKLVLPAITNQPAALKPMTARSA